MEVPEDLQDAGKAFWEEVTDPSLNLILKPDEWPLLAEACRCLDLVESLRAEFAANPETIVKGSTGQPTINPILKHIDTTVGRYQSLTRQISIPDLDDDRALKRAAAVSADMASLGRLSYKRRGVNTG